MQPQHENKDAASPRKNVLNLSIKNFMSVKDAKLELGKITQIVGGNSQGKTTLIKAIQTAIKGSSDTSLITHGEDRMEIILELPDETHIRRAMTARSRISRSMAAISVLKPSRSGTTSFTSSFATARYCLPESNLVSSPLSLTSFS